MQHSMITPPPTPPSLKIKPSSAQGPNRQRQSVSEPLNPGIRIPESGPRPLKSSAEGSGQSLGGDSVEVGQFGRHIRVRVGAPQGVWILEIDGNIKMRPVALNLFKMLDGKTEMGDDDLACDLLCSLHGDQRKAAREPNRGRGRPRMAAQGCGRPEKISRHVRVVVEGLLQVSLILSPQTAQWRST